MVKNVYTVSEISKSASVSADSVRYYASIGLIKPHRNPDNGYKLFKQDDIKRIRFIRQAQGLGFTLSDIRQIFDHSNMDESPCPIVRSLIQKRLAENKQKLAELIKLQKRMENALKLWDSMPDGEPDGDAICHLIESIY